MRQHRWLSLLAEHVWRKRLRLFAVGVTVVCLAQPCVAEGVSSADQASSSTVVDPVFRGIVDELRTQTEIPVLLPRQLPDVGQGQDTVYAVLAAATANAYRIVLGFTPDCDGGTACRLGELSARPVGATDALAASARPVALPDGTAALFVDAVCGANCSDAVLTWKAGGVERSASLKAGRLDDVTRLAAAVIDGTLIERH